MSLACFDNFGFTNSITIANATPSIGKFLAGLGYTIL